MEKEDDFSSIFSETEQDLHERENKISERGLKKMEFDEQYYFKNKPDWLSGLYKKIDDYCLNGIKKGIKRAYLKTYIRWTYKGKMFCRIFVYRDNLKVYLRLKYAELENPPAFIRDYTDIGRVTAIEILLSEEYLQNEEAFFVIVSSLIEKSFLEVTGARRLGLVKKRSLEPVKPVKAFEPSSLNLSVDGDGYININLKIKKSQKEILERILQETIFK